MLLTINPTSKTPLYIQIYKQIKDKIHQHELNTNEKLPSKRQLAQQNNVSQNTILNAYNQLLTEGYIYAIERTGYFVADVELLVKSPEPLGEMDDKPIEKKQEILYDFTRSNPDVTLFPFSVFSKLYREHYSQQVTSFLKESVGQGLVELREALQRYLSQARGVPCRKEQIILGPNSEYLLSILFQLFDYKPYIGLENPGYPGFNALIKRFALPTQAISLDDKGIQVDKLEASDIELMIVTSNHQFPTGTIMPLDRRQELLKWANKNTKHYVIENDYDSEFKYSGIPIPSLKYLDQQQKVIHLGSFTRVISPSIRMSYMVLPEPLLEQYVQKFPNHSSVLSTSEQWVIRNFITEGHFTTHLNRSRTFYKKKRDALLKTIYHMDPQAKIHGENAGLHLLLSPSFHFDGLRFKEMALAAGIKLNLLSDYAVGGHNKDEHVIFLSFSNLPKEDFERVIEKLYEIAKKCAQ